MEQSIGDILSGAEPEPEAVTEEVVEQPEVQEEQPETAERPRGPDGKFIAKEQTGVEPQAAEPVPPTEPTNQLPREEYQALRAIRDENRELKAHMAAIQQQMQAQRPQLTQAEEIDFWENPQAFMANMTGNLRQQILQDLRQEQQIERVNASEEAAKAKYADYDDAYQAFERAVQLNPSLAHELARSADPAEFAYSKGKTALAIQQVGSIDGLRAQIRAEIEAEARQAFNPAPVRLPSTTAADGSVGGRGGPVWSGPAALGDILKP